MESNLANLKVVLEQDDIETTFQFFKKKQKVTKLKFQWCNISDYKNLNMKLKYKFSIYFEYKFSKYSKFALSLESQMMVHSDQRVLVSVRALHFMAVSQKEFYCKWYNGTINTRKLQINPVD